ncbi:MAG: ABC transporter substrate-binding protein [Gaiellales bacterium]
MHRTRLITRTTVIAAALLALGALAGTAAAQRAATVNVGAALTLTGTNQAYGLSSRRGIDMAVKEINAGAVRGVRINVKTVDDLGTAQGASAAYGIFFRDGVNVIMGPTLSSVALTVDHFAQGARIPVLGISNTQPGITEIGTFVFRPALTENVLLPNLVKTVAASSIAPKTVVLIQGSDEFATTSAPIFAGAFEANQIALTKTIVVPAGTADFTAIAAEVKAADPDVVAITALPAEGIPLLKALRAAGVRKKVLGSNAFNTQEIITGAGAAANGLIVGTPWTIADTSKRNQKFVKAFRKLYKRSPDQFAATAYAYTYVVAQAAKNGGAASQAAMQTQLAALVAPKRVSTLLGRFRFDANRNGISPVRVQQVLGGKFKLFKPAQ